MHCRQSGLTLIESSVAVAIFAITSAIAFPSLQDLVQRQRSISTTHRLLADMALARSRAVVQRQQVVVCPRDSGLQCADQGDWSRGWLVFLDRDGNRQPDGEADVLRVGDPPGGSRLSITSSRPFLRYQVDGRSAHSNLTVRMCVDGLLTGQIIVNNHGRARSFRPSGTESCPRG